MSVLEGVKVSPKKLEVSVDGPEPQELRVRKVVAHDIRRELLTRRRRDVRLPAGSHFPSLKRTSMLLRDPLSLMTEHYERFGPVFTIRAGHEPIVFALGAQANHEILVTKPRSFRWRESKFRELSHLLGDGMLNIDGEYHDQMRHLLVPVFHRAQVQLAVESMVEEAHLAVQSLPAYGVTDVNGWVRSLALQIALRSLIGLEPEDCRVSEFAEHFEAALGFHDRDVALQYLRGPKTPFADLLAHTRQLDDLIFAEIDRRRSANTFGNGALGMLLAAHDEAGRPLDAKAVRDQAVTILFAGHDTTTATISFMLHELARNPQIITSLQSELDEKLEGRDPAPNQLDGVYMPYLERVIQETLRKFPAAWIGPRFTVEDVEIAGVMIPKGVSVLYSSYGTHNLPDHYPDPHRFDPDRFLPEAINARPKGAYIPFAAGSRMCLGKRFGEYEIRTIAAILLANFTPEVVSKTNLQISTTPTIGPKGGLYLALRRR